MALSFHFTETTVVGFIAPLFDIPQAPPEGALVRGGFGGGIDLAQLPLELLVLCEDLLPLLRRGLRGLRPLLQSLRAQMIDLLLTPFLEKEKWIETCVREDTE